MTIYNLGSLNIDLIFAVDRFPAIGETLTAQGPTRGLGGKGANLAEMASIGLPVPPGFTISTEVCTYFYDHGRRHIEYLMSVIQGRNPRSFSCILQAEQCQMLL